MSATAVDFFPSAISSDGHRCECYYVCGYCVATFIHYGDKHNCKQCVKALDRYEHRYNSIDPMRNKSPRRTNSPADPKSLPNYTFFQFFENDLQYVVDENGVKVGTYSPREKEWFSLPGNERSDMCKMCEISFSKQGYGYCDMGTILMAKCGYTLTTDYVPDEVAEKVNIHHTTKYTKYHQEILGNGICDTCHNMLKTKRRPRTVFLNGVEDDIVAAKAAIDAAITRDELITGFGFGTVNVHNEEAGEKEAARVEEDLEEEAARVEEDLEEEAARIGNEAAAERMRICEDEQSRKDAEEDAEEDAEARINIRLAEYLADIADIGDIGNTHTETTQVHSRAVQDVLRSQVDANASCITQDIAPTETSVINTVNGCRTLVFSTTITTTVKK